MARPPASKRPVEANGKPTAATNEPAPESTANGRTAKRARTAEPETPARKTRGRSATPAADGSVAGTPRRRAAAAALNALPQPRDLGPLPYSVFVCGTGDMAAFGLGIDRLDDEIVRPELHTWFRDALSAGKLGSGGIREIECGGMHTLTIDDDGKVWSWGPNDDAALGRKTVGIDGKSEEEAESEPMPVEGLHEKGFKAVRVAAGDCVSIALSSEGLLRAWGSFKSGDGGLGFDGRKGGTKHQKLPIALPGIEKKTFCQVACGTNHVLALTTDGRVWTWGNGEQAQLGRKIIERHKVNGLTPTQLALKKIVLVGAGSYHSFAVDVNGIVWSWGLNIHNQTGVAQDDGGDEQIITVPAPVDALHPSNNGGSRVIAIRGGEHHSVFLLDNGTVMTCGRNDDGQCGLGEKHPIVVANREAIAQLRQKRTEQIPIERAKLEQEGKVTEPMELDALAHQNAVAAVPIPDQQVPTPTIVTFPNGTGDTVPFIVGIAAGTQNSLAWSRQGDAFAWGLGLSAQLGLADSDGDAIDTARSPKRIKSKDLATFRVVSGSLGGQTSFILGGPAK